MGNTRVPMLIAPPQAAVRMGCSVRTIYRMVACGQLRAYRLGTKHIRIDVADLDKALRPIVAAETA